LGARGSYHPAAVEQPRSTESCSLVATAHWSLSIRCVRGKIGPADAIVEALCRMLHSRCAHCSLGCLQPWCQANLQPAGRQQQNSHPYELWGPLHVGPFHIAKEHIISLMWQTTGIELSGQRAQSSCLHKVCRNTPENLTAFMRAQNRGSGPLRSKLPE